MTGPRARAVGRIIAKGRAKARLTLAELEQVAGIPGTWIFHVEKGHYTDPAPERIGRLASALNIDPADLNRVGDDYLADGLAERRIYLRGKEKLPLEALDEVDRFLNELHRKYDTEAPS